jgi:hypothetical protein
VSFENVKGAHSSNGFPLTGAHAIPCSSCHGEPFNPDLDRACYGCHRSSYEATTDPSHAESGFGTDCSLCHNTTSFEGATFNHSTTSFPLTGAHLAQPCSACHADGVYDGKPTSCYSCHQSDYTGVPDPNHVGARFSTTCTDCHNTTGFSGARFTRHDGSYFPIYSGRHSGRWGGCSDCHTTSSDYRIFSCFFCHDQADTTSRHHDVSGFRFESSACYSCHPRGEAD